MLIFCFGYLNATLTSVVRALVPHNRTFLPTGGAIEKFLLQATALQHSRELIKRKWENQPFVFFSPIVWPMQTRMLLEHGEIGHRVMQNVVKVIKFENGNVICNQLIVRDRLLNKCDVKISHHVVSKWSSIFVTSKDQDFLIIWIRERETLAFF